MSPPPTTPSRPPRSPSAPQADGVALIDATRPAGQATPGRLDTAVATLSFLPASSPRRLSQRGDRPSIDDDNHPPRKRPNLTATPSRRPMASTAAASAPASSTTNLAPAGPPAGVTLSPTIPPPNAAAEPAARDAVRTPVVLTAKGRARADRKQQQAERARQAEAKRRR